MRAVIVEKARKIDRTNKVEAEQSFETTLSDIARYLWPHKTAAELAARLDCTERAAELYLANDRKWSGDSVALIVSEILRRHGMRNARVKAK